MSSGLKSDAVGRVAITTGGAQVVSAEFRPTSYDVDLTMDGTAQVVALATGVRQGAGRVRIANWGATTEYIRAAFGDSASAAQTALTMDTGANPYATTGLRIGSAADGYKNEMVLSVPATATHIAVANGAASDTQDVSVTQGV